MIVDYSKHYGADYWLGRSTYKTADGRTHTYHGPALAWEGFDLVSDALLSIFKPGTLLDIGCGGGDLARRLQRRGFSPYGIDISQYAVDNAVPEMRGRIALADITTCPEKLVGDPAGQKTDTGLLFPEQFDLLLSTDLMEHIYKEDLDETFDWMLSKTKKSMFLLVATAMEPAPGVDPNKWGFTAVKGQPIPIEWQATAASGHVHVQPFTYWCKFFMAKGLRINWQAMYLFQMKREAHEAWKATGGWGMPMTFVLEKK